MILAHPAHPSRRVRLGYCLNLDAPESLDDLLATVATYAVGVRELLGAPAPFGVGMYVPAALARRLADPGQAHELDRLSAFLAASGLDAFTWNAFPFGGFATDGLKARVFEPTWARDERLAFTLDVARVAAACARSIAPAPDGSRRLSISTHTGGFGAPAPGDRVEEDCAARLARCVDGLAALEEASGVRVVLALEPEPGANAPTIAALDAFLARVRPIAVALLAEERNRAADRAAVLVERHLGACLDLCHAAVEGESGDLERDLARGARRVPAKVQYANALRVRDPATNAAGVEALLALAEPRYLHQVRAHGGREPLGVDDLPDLARELAGPRRAAWLAARAWTCHLHVPVDLDAAGGALGTTRADADALLASLLAAPDRWPDPELHLEIETYTWEVLPGWVRGADARVEGIAREYRHVLAVLERQGWRPAGLPGR